MKNATVPGLSKCLVEPQNKRLPDDRYRSMVQPYRDSVGEALEEALGCGYEYLDCDKQRHLQNAVQLVNTFTFESSMGRQSIGDVVYRRAGNCLGLACLLCSMLRRAGFSEHEAFVMIASLDGGALHRIHALVVVKQGSGLVVIDSETRKTFKLTSRLLAAQYTVFVVFNDKVQAFTTEEKRCILSPTRSE